MVGKLAFTLAGTLGVASSALAAQCMPPTEFEPAMCRIKVPAIASITIVRNGAGQADPNDLMPDCAVFIVKPNLIRQFMARAKRVDAKDHNLGYSPCYANGTLKTRDGRMANWSISAAQVGTLQFRGQAEQWLYCPSCGGKAWPSGF